MVCLEPAAAPWAKDPEKISQQNFVCRNERSQLIDTDEWKEFTGLAADPFL